MFPSQAGTALPPTEAFGANTEAVSVGAQTCREDQSAWALAPALVVELLILCPVQAEMLGSRGFTAINSTIPPE